MISFAKIKLAVIYLLGVFRSAGKKKIFCIGLNKTGTTSLKIAMKELGYVVGHQRTAEKLNNDWGYRNFNKLKWYCRTAVFFQDVPFSKPFTFVVLDHVFPKSKFILTIRDNPDQWYHSITKFHSKLWGIDGQVPTKEDLIRAKYIYKGYPWDNNRLTFNTPEDDPYKKDVLVDYYMSHNKYVIEYFRHRPDDLLVLNVAEPGAYTKLCKFLGIQPQRSDFPWENKT